MKNILAAFVAILLTGCGSTGLQNYGAWQQGITQYQARQAAPANDPVSLQVQSYGQLRPSVNTDNQCMQGCLQRGYQYGFCQKQCAY